MNRLPPPLTLAQIGEHRIDIAVEALGERFARRADFGKNGVGFHGNAN